MVLGFLLFLIFILPVFFFKSHSLQRWQRKSLAQGGVDSVFVMSIVKQSIPRSNLCLAFMCLTMGSVRLGIRVSGNGLRRLIWQALRIVTWRGFVVLGKDKKLQGGENCILRMSLWILLLALRRKVAKPIWTEHQLAETWGWRTSARCISMALDGGKQKEKQKARLVLSYASTHLNIHIPIHISEVAQGKWRKSILMPARCSMGARVSYVAESNRKHHCTLSE